MEHFDFKVLDVLSILSMFILIIKQHIPFTTMQFVSSAAILVLFVLLFDIITDIHNFVMYRGVLKEFVVSFVYMGIYSGTILAYLHFIAHVPISRDLSILFFLASAATN